MLKVKDKDESCPNVGGQAVIEGVMMKGVDYLATAVRKPTGEIVYRRKKIKKRVGLDYTKIPFMRGVFVLFETLVMGVKELTFSAAQSGETEEDEISDFEIGVTLVVAFAIGIALFFMLPALVGSLIKDYRVANVLEGIVRVVIFLAYISLISLMKDIRRVFQYHGAEHKSIYAYENRESLTVDNAKKYSALHPRCGTSFLLIVMVFSIVVFAVSDTLLLHGIEKDKILSNIVKFSSRLLLLPVIAGLAYEFQRFTGRNVKKAWVKMIAYPGMMLQKLTTGEPDEKQLEVALVALRAALGEENIENAREIKEEVK